MKTRALLMTMVLLLLIPLSVSSQDLAPKTEEFPTLIRVQPKSYAKHFSRSDIEHLRKAAKELKDAGVLLPGGVIDKVKLATFKREHNLVIEDYSGCPPYTQGPEDCPEPSGWNNTGYLGMYDMMVGSHAEDYCCPALWWQIVTWFWLKNNADPWYTLTIGAWANYFVFLFALL
jgi:hypothetical protein